MKVNREQISTPPDGQPAEQQPAWRQDFPIDVPQDNYVSRRDFAKFMVLTSGAFAVGQFTIAGKSVLDKNGPRPEARRVASVADIPVGGALTFTYPHDHDPCLLLRPDEHTFLAYGQKCTHLSCAVTPNHEANCLHCPCHNGNFDMATGRPLSGPPRRPLPRVVIERRGDDLFALAMEERTV
jgi:Rieske Fe-S protein